ncbi:hypothetical protein G9A89_000357 [Geosiphon pyriformis]|nr:hypothetical protein G9A89_000357 [Geosiphon pyriformis]
MSEDEVELQRVFNEEADLLYSGDAAPSLHDAQSVVSMDKDVHIPRSLVQARITLQRALLLFSVLLGDNHRLVYEYQEYIAKFQCMETRLETAKPRNPRHYHLVPALLIRRIQLETNEWLCDQAVTPGQVPVIRMTDVFREISLRRDWAPDLPETYLQTLSSADSNTASHTVVSDLTTPTIASLGTRTATTTTSQNTTSSGANTSGRTPGQPKNNPDFNATTFETFRSKSLITKRVKAYCQANNIALPLNRDNKPVAVAMITGPTIPTKITRSSPGPKPITGLAPTLTQVHLPPMRAPPPNKRPRLIALDELGKQIILDSKSSSDVYHLFRARQGRRNFADLSMFQQHPAYHLLRLLRNEGAPVVMSTSPWT